MALLIITLCNELSKIIINHQQPSPQYSSYNNQAAASNTNQISAPVDEPPPPYQQYAPAESQQQPRARWGPRWQLKHVTAPEIMYGPAHAYIMKYRMQMRWAGMEDGEGWLGDIGMDRFLRWWQSWRNDETFILRDRQLESAQLFRFLNGHSSWCPQKIEIRASTWKDNLC